jgi:hypothetical protein
MYLKLVTPIFLGILVALTLVLYSCDEGDVQYNEPPSMQQR